MAVELLAIGLADMRPNIACASAKELDYGHGKFTVHEAPFEKQLVNV